MLTDPVRDEETDELKYFMACGAAVINTQQVPDKLRFHYRPELTGAFLTARANTLSPTGKRHAY